MLAGHVDTAIPRLRAALDQLPAEHLGPLWLYNARVRQGEMELARTELEASLKKQRNDDWPRPIAEFYLGKLDESGLLDRANKDSKAAHARTCMATSYMAEWHAARNEKAQADSLLATLHAHCSQPRAAAPAPAAT
jgi:lipoprotein NlpI